MDCRRLESAHMRFAVLTVCTKYNALAQGNIGLLPIYPDIHETLAEITPTYFAWFRSEFSGNNAI